MVDSLPRGPVSASRLRSFIAVTSTLKREGRFTAAAVRRWHLPSASHSVTVSAAQISGADPSYLPAASAGDGARAIASIPKAAAADRDPFIVFLQSDTAYGRRTSISSPCSR